PLLPLCGIPCYGAPPCRGRRPTRPGSAPPHLRSPTRGERTMHDAIDRQGENEAFWDAFARRYARDLPRSVAKAMRAVGWRAAPADVDEMVQEVYIRLLERPDAAEA